MIRTGTTSSMETAKTPVTPGVQQPTKESDLFSADFHANHASMGDFGFDDDDDDAGNLGDGDGDFGWANQQFATHTVSSTAEAAAGGGGRSLSKLIKPRTRKIDDDDQTWFSEASDVEGPVACSSRRDATQKKRRKPKRGGTLTKGNITGGNRRKVPVAHNCEDQRLLQHPNGRAGDATDDDSSVEENLFPFSSNFDAFGTQHSASQSFEDGSTSHNNQSAMDNSTNHSNTPFFPSFDNPDTTAGPPSVMHSSVSTNHSSVNSSPVRGSKKAPTKKSISASSRVISKGTEQALQVTSLLEDNHYHSSPESLSPHGTDKNDDAPASPRAKGQRVFTSLVAAAALMNKPETRTDNLDPVSAHSTHSFNAFSSNTMGTMYMQPKRVDPLSASDHGPARHGRMGNTTKPNTSPKRRTIVRQKSTGCIKSTTSNTHVNTGEAVQAGDKPRRKVVRKSNKEGAPLSSDEDAPVRRSPLPGRNKSISGSSDEGQTLHGNKIARQRTLKSSNNCMSGSSDEGAPRGNGIARRRTLNGGINPNKNTSGSLDEGAPRGNGIARRRTLNGGINPNKSTSGSSDEGAPRGNGIARRRTLNGGINPNKSTSGSSDDGERTGNGIARRRTLHNAGNPNNHNLDMSQPASPAKKKIIRRRCSDGGVAKEGVITSTTKDNVRRRAPASQTKAAPQELSKVSQVTKSKQNMVKLHAELKQGKGSQRNLKPVATKPQTSPRRMLHQKQTFVSNLPTNQSQETLESFSHSFTVAAKSADDTNVHSSDEMVTRKKTTRSSDSAIETNPHSSDEMVARQRPTRASTTTLDRHMTKRRPKKMGGPSGSASLAGHELQMKKKKIRAPSSDLSLLQGREGLTQRISGSASVSGDQIARRPVTRRPVSRINSQSGDEASTQLRRKPVTPGQTIRHKKLEQHGAGQSTSFG